MAGHSPKLEKSRLILGKGKKHVIEQIVVIKIQTGDSGRYKLRHISKTKSDGKKTRLKLAVV